MKKFFVSSVVIIAFIAYCLYQKAYGVQAVSIVAPKSISNMQQFVPSNTPSLAPTLSPTLIPTQPISQKIMPSKAPIIVPQSTSTPTPTPKSGYKDGTYPGNPADAFYGIIQVQATISNGKIVNIQFLQAPNDRGTSIEINSQADPMLAQEAISAQSANVNIISGATDSSIAFVQSLQSALNKAKN